MQQVHFAMKSGYSEKSRDIRVYIYMYLHKSLLVTERQAVFAHSVIVEFALLVLMLERGAGLSEPLHQKTSIGQRKLQEELEKSRVTSFLVFKSCAILSVRVAPSLLKLGFKRKARISTPPMSKEKSSPSTTSATL